MTPGYPPHHPGLHPTQSSMSRGAPGGASIATTPGSIGTIDDDKGRGSYKCGRCGVPKKGHICPYQPKVKRNPNDPAPEMKCVSTQVEMDEFMTLRRLNIEIQGFPESYAAEPSDNCGTEVHPPPQQQQQHHGAMTPSSQQPHGPPSAGPPPGSIVEPGMAPPSHLSGPHSSSLPPPGAAAMSSMQQGPPTSLPSLSSMPSHPHPISAAPPSVGAITTTKTPEQINSSAASVKTGDVTGAASDVNLKAEKSSTDTEHTNTPNKDEEEATKADSTTHVEKEESKPENDNKDKVETTKEMSAENAPKSDNNANKKRSASEEEKSTGEDEDCESPVKKQKV